MRRAVVALCLVSAVTAGCGVTGEGKDVKSALKDFASATKSGDGDAICAGITPESRRLFDVIGRGYTGPDGDCRSVIEEQFTEAASIDTDAIDDADVDVEGDTARLKGGGDEQRLPMRKVDGKWLVDMANLPEQGYGLRGSAVCTQSILRAQARPLPAPTREGIAADAEQDAKDLERLVKTLDGLEPPEGQADAHERLLGVLRDSAKSWRRAARGLRGVGAPIDTYNEALGATEKRGRAALDDQRKLGVGCFGTAETLKGASDYRRTAQRVCTAAVREVGRVTDAGGGGAALAGGLRDAGVSAAKALRKIEAPEGLGDLHRATTNALDDAYATFPQVATAADPDRAQTRIELLGLKSSVGFFRLGLPKCAEL